MKKIFTKEVIIGLVTIVSLFVLYFGINYLKGVNLFKPNNHYYVSLSNVPELQNSSPIYVNGFKVGLVNAINYNFEAPGNITVEISLDKKMKVPTGSYVKLRSGLTSGAYLDLVLNKYVSTYCEVGDTIKGSSDPGMMDKLAKDLMPQVENLLPRLDSILLGIQVLVNHPALTQSLDHVSATTANLEKSTRQLNSLLSNDVPDLVSDLKQVSSDFSVITGNLKTIDLNKTMQTVDITLESVQQMAKQLNNKDNSLGLLLNDRQLYDNLTSTTENASNLLLDLKENPKKYVHFSVF